VANAILLLQEQGKLKLEDSLYKYFPDFKNTDIAKKIKIKHLLTHTSGLPDNRKVNNDSVFYLSAKDQENWYPVTQTDTLVFEPGSQFEYSNPAFNGLALIIEKVSGMKWQQFVAKNIFEPSGMPTSTITDGPHPERGVSHGYVKNNDQWIEDDYGEEPTFPAAGNGGVWSSLEELANYEKAIQQSVFLSSQNSADSRTVKRFENWKGSVAFSAGWSWFKPVSHDNLFSPIIGWSWFVGETQSGLKTVGHTGSQGGFLCNYVSIPEKKILFIILCNSPRDVYSYSDKIMDLLNL
jgi:CubicO group peptidase (beta-lactamase class C family)